MFLCQVELLSSLPQPNGEPFYLGVGKYNFDPNLQVGDEVWVNDWEVGGKTYHLKTKVVARKKEIHPPDHTLERFGAEAIRNGLFILRIFVEAEDRDAVLEISENIERHKSTAGFPA
ncbi:hypothetical protein NIES2135_07170 [Leptolyngbya boryana NIES-2135]|jgi:hypothetical protein|uniref:Uncharacterized protein n=1 Tax=Leptolyngbya boryana NIES-2135 TaxID=1973484 RepID=A0A1Z4JAU9_LEPBY|nr:MULTISPECIES: hypothetical protein [Leptolyngbya]BAY53904.1 hypothetical protein NIES2135_07170 [Leptolyngbya boryana NIES-2135]MBD2371468.1 hypothetical protein [Leptolyngbya sp. FACHB-161]MBD2377980.1 hypothetical protein [Leptolyngbya sp. FACHB-238]MBD2402415.1 hypothetical protein [Leptolyngbya sp. FACHB-239]MBD2408899.1 hypothetical protein [Leptolyngbya sp. FACHB-402]